VSDLARFELPDPGAPRGKITEGIVASADRRSPPRMILAADPPGSPLAADIGSTLAPLIARRPRSRGLATDNDIFAHVCAVIFST
jgi:hypothetical protein